MLFGDNTEISMMLFNITSSQYIPRIRDRLSAMIPGQNVVTTRTNRRSIIFDNSAIFDSSPSSMSDPTFVGFSRSEVVNGFFLPVFGLSPIGSFSTPLVNIIRIHYCFN